VSAVATVVPLLGNAQQLDGGAMFGNAPKALWERWVEVDERNRIPLATRSLLVREDSGRHVLLEAGVGAFFAPHLRERFGVVQDHHVLVEQLAVHGLSPDDIDVVVLSHLHFDHAGGVLRAWQADHAPALLFDRARYVVSEAAWERASAPTARDRASFIAELPELLAATGRVELVTGPASTTLGDDYRLRQSHGHTPGLLLTEVDGGRGPVLYASDLVPARPWVHVPITMGYDRFPELVVEEKAALLADVVERDVWLAFPHDPEVAMARIARDDAGRFTSAETLA
jgi:glyoxylase-like metal-dependent hydrolase (beta-lactamase superfamily II)